MFSCSFEPGPKVKGKSLLKENILLIGNTCFGTVYRRQKLTMKGKTYHSPPRHSFTADSAGFIWKSFMKAFSPGTNVLKGV